MENKKTKKAKGVNPVSESESKKITEFQQADGKVYNKYKVTSIDELLGKRSGKYEHSNVEDYAEYLKNMNVSDLQAHATRVGIMPNQDRNVLTKRLIKEFTVTNSGFYGTVQPQAVTQKPVSDDVLKILSQGR